MTLGPGRAAKQALVVAICAVAAFVHPGAVHSAVGAILVTGEVRIVDPGGPPPDLIVKVHAGFGEGFAVVGQTRVDSDGRYGLELPLQTDNRLFVSVSFRGVTYSTDPIVVPADGPAKLAPITVFGTTDDQSVIRIESSTIVVAQIDRQRQQITVLEMMTLVNDSSSAYIGDKPMEPGTGVPAVLNRTFTIDLPDGAGGFQPQSGFSADQLMPGAGKFFFTDPVLPGRRQIVYSYQIGYPFSVHLFARPLSYQTDRLRVLMPETGARIESLDLEEAGLTELQGRRYQMLLGENLPAGTTVHLQVSGLPVRQVGLQLDLATMRVLTAVLAVFALSAVATYAYRVRTISFSNTMGDGSQTDARREQVAQTQRPGATVTEPNDE